MGNLFFEYSLENIHIQDELTLRNKIQIQPFPGPSHISHP
jgi:hypothetical protein